jgi:hypothetical protein
VFTQHGGEEVFHLIVNEQFFSAVESGSDKELEETAMLTPLNAPFGKAMYNQLETLMTITESRCQN